jgi:hypothetical protein
VPNTPGEVQPLSALCTTPQTTESTPAATAPIPAPLRADQLIRDLTGASIEEAQQFLATGMLLTVTAAMRVAGPEAVAEPWAADLLGSLEGPAA